MTKQEIYSQVVELTSEIQKTGFAKDLFGIADLGFPEYVEKIIQSFRNGFPKLNQKIIDFGLKFNSLLQETEDDKKKQNELEKACLINMYELSRDDMISKIYNAFKTKNPIEIGNIIMRYIEEHPVFSHNLLVFQKRFNKVFMNGKTGNEGQIFGNEEDNYPFDTEKIDSLSLCVLIILSGIDEVFLFDCDSFSFDIYLDALEEAGYKRLAHFCANESFPDFIVDHSEDFEYPNIQELLVAIFNGDLDEI